jgi:hypothetical protein
MAINLINQLFSKTCEFFKIEIINWQLFNYVYSLINQQHSGPIEQKRFFYRFKFIHFYLTKIFSSEKIRHRKPSSYCTEFS